MLHSTLPALSTKDVKNGTGMAATMQLYLAHWCGVVCCANFSQVRQMFSSFLVLGADGNYTALALVHSEYLLGRIAAKSLLCAAFARSLMDTHSE